MPIATGAGEKVRTMRADLDKLFAIESPSTEELEAAVKLNDEITVAETEYLKLKSVDDANEARKSADEAERAKSLKPVTRPGLALANNNGRNLDAERQETALVSSNKSWSTSLIESAIYKAVHDQGHHSGTAYSVTIDDAIGLSVKAAGDPITTTQFGTRVTELALVPHVFPPATVLPLINVVNVGAGSIRYYQATMPPTGGPDWTAEAALKPEIQLRWAPVDAPVETLAEWTAVTLQALDDLPQLRSVIDFDLRRALLNKLDDSILNGNGTTPQIRGILNFAGIQTPTFVAATSPADMIAKGIAAVSSTGYGVPNAVVMNPADWWAVRTSKIGTPPASFYLWGSPTEMGTPNIYGLPVVSDSHMPAGFALVGDFSYATFYQRMGVTFIVGLKNDDLIRNITTIVCELRGTLAVTRPGAFAKVPFA
jgi:HK97 family phage major capsid protein